MSSSFTGCNRVLSILWRNILMSLTDTLIKKIHKLETENNRLYRELIHIKLKRDKIEKMNLSTTNEKD